VQQTTEHEPRRATGGLRAPVIRFIFADRMPEERMAYTAILYSVEGFVATITLNRPDRLNAWTSEMDAEVRAAIESAAADEKVRAIVLTGAGRGFCAGADMSRLTRLSAGEAPRSIVGDNGSKPGNFEQKFSYLLAVPKPIFAAINGPVAGIALCLVLFCDFRYMAEGAKLTTAFAKRGLIAEHGSSWMLPRLIGPMNALDLLYSARMVEATEAERLGLVRKLPAENFLPSVQSIARELVTASSPRSIGVIKRQVFQSYFQSLAEAWAVADKEMIASFGSEDFKEGVAHFLEKRAAAFSGR
jgi:enoyl-CoA hydratase/carnithine racemase